MRKFLALYIILLLPTLLFAQMDIDYAPSRVSVELPHESFKTFEIKDDYFSEAKFRADKIALRKQRNTLEVSPGLEASLNTLNDAWIETSGGANTISATTTLYLRHKYTKNRLSVESYFSAVFGYYRVNVERTAEDGSTYEEAVWYKNQDAFSFSVSPSLSMARNWSYGATFSFRSQFANGYVSSTSQEDIHLKSAFLSPAYLTMSLGINYQSPSEKFPIKVTLSPLALNSIFVRNKEVRQNAIYQYSKHEASNFKYTDPYGVSPYESSKFEGGSSLQFDFDRTFGQRSTVRYMTSLYSFYGWISNVTYSNIYKDYATYEDAVADWDETASCAKPLYVIKPTVRWLNRVELKATKLLYTNINFELYYNRAQNSGVQTKTILSLGLSYKFSNNAT